MGILDDAIREHLDLKRRLGAEDDEIQRLEDEAFGPPSRPGEPDFPETGETQAQAPETGEQTFFDDVADGPREAAPPEVAELPEEPQASAAPPIEEPVVEVPFEVDDPAAHLEVLTEPAVTEPDADEPPIESLDTVEHHFEGAIEDTGEAQVVEAEPAAEPPAPETDERAADEGEEDVLEETPEFLRDQPEDDELWFEQGEPKDFDF